MITEFVSSFGSGNGEARLLPFSPESLAERKARITNSVDRQRFWGEGRVREPYSRNSLTFVECLATGVVQTID